MGVAKGALGERGRTAGTASLNSELAALGKGTPGDGLRKIGRQAREGVELGTLGLKSGDGAL